jgi:FixJ family two-component response regulator
VIAPEDDLQRSVSFLIEAEGFEVALYKNLSEAMASPAAAHAACAIIDSKTISDLQELRAHVGLFQRPVILLVERPGRLPALPRCMTLTKPFLGPALVEAVWTASAAPR